MIQRHYSQSIQIGKVTIGGDAPIVVQSMTKTDTRDAAATIEQIRRLEECGCELVRVAVPDLKAAQSIAEIKKGINIPLVADIHFDYRLALASLEHGADALRLNPGNLRDPEHIAAVVQAAKERQTPIRIGVNAGSMPPDEGCQSSAISSTTGIVSRMVEAAMAQIRLLESLDFNLIKVSLKAFDVPTTVEAYRAIASRIPYPLHLGITESGLTLPGSIRSAIGLGILLSEGIGDTIRVSLTDTPEKEVFAAYEILKSLNLREHGPTLVSCPTCGRCEIDLISLAKKVGERLQGVSKPIKVAVMGCVVNGPGEAREADVGIAGGKGKGALFRKGKVVRTLPEEELLSALMSEIEDL